jgi:hypothetical protein
MDMSEVMSVCSMRYWTCGSPDHAENIIGTPSVILGRGHKLLLQAKKVLEKKTKFNITIFFETNGLYQDKKSKDRA